MLHTFFIHLRQKELEVIDEPETELEVVDKSEPEVVDESGPEAPVLIELEVVDELDSEVDEAELALEVEEPPINTRVELPTEPIMELMPFLTAMILRSPDFYDPLLIFIQDMITGDWCLGIWISFQWN